MNSLRILIFLISLQLLGFGSQAQFFGQEDALRIVQAQDASLTPQEVLLSINSIHLYRSSTSHQLENLPLLLEQMHQHLSSRPLQIFYQGRTITILPQILGQGTRGIVYPVLGENLGVKIPKPDWISMFRLREEGERAIQVENMARENSLDTPQNLHFDRLGLFAVKERVSGPTLTEVFLSMGVVVRVMQPDGDWHFALGSHETMRSPHVASLLWQMARLIQVRRNNRDLLGDLGPNNFLVSSGRIFYVDIGRSFEGTLVRYDAVQNIDDYLKSVLSDLEKYKQRGLLPSLPDLHPTNRFLCKDVLLSAG